MEEVELMVGVPARLLVQGDWGDSGEGVEDAAAAAGSEG